MACWLFKSEPSSWSWDEQVAAGAAGTAWTGVRNALAQKHMAAMREGERGFFYHSNEGRAIVGIVEVCRAWYPDPEASGGKRGLVDLRAVEPVPHPVTLERVKATPALAEMVLVRNSRLSVQPVTDAEWEAVLALARQPG